MEKANFLMEVPTEEEWRQLKYDMIVSYIGKDKKLAKMIRKYLDRSVGRK